MFVLKKTIEDTFKSKSCFGVASPLIVFSLALLIAKYITPSWTKPVLFYPNMVAIMAITGAKVFVDEDLKSPHLSMIGSSLYQYVIGKTIGIFLFLIICIVSWSLYAYWILPISLPIYLFLMKLAVSIVPIILISFLITLITPPKRWPFIMFVYTMGALYTERAWSLSQFSNLVSLPFVIQYIPSIILPHMGVMRSWLFGPILNFCQVDYVWEIAHYIVINLLMIILIKRKLSNIVNDPWRLQKLESPLY